MVKIKKARDISRKRKHHMGAKRHTNMNGNYMENGYTDGILKMLTRKSVKR